MSSPSGNPSEKTSSRLLAARQSPDFALRYLAALEPEARAEVLKVWCLTPPQAAPAPAIAPRLRKCSSAGVAPCPLGAQLEAFARSVRRVG